MMLLNFICYIEINVVFVCFIYQWVDKKIVKIDIYEKVCWILQFIFWYVSDICDRLLVQYVGI